MSITGLTAGYVLSVKLVDDKIIINYSNRVCVYDYQLNILDFIHLGVSDYTISNILKDYIIFRIYSFNGLVAYKKDGSKNIVLPIFLDQDYQCYENFIYYVERGSIIKFDIEKNKIIVVTHIPKKIFTILIRKNYLFIIEKYNFNKSVAIVNLKKDSDHIRVFTKQKQAYYLENGNYLVKHNNFYYEYNPFSNLPPKKLNLCHKILKSFGNILVCQENENLHIYDLSSQEIILTCPGIIYDLKDLKLVTYNGQINIYDCKKFYKYKETQILENFLLETEFIDFSLVKTAFTLLFLESNLN